MRCCKSKRAMSLIEVLIVTAILALSLIPILGMFHSRSVQAKGTGHRTRAHSHLMNALQNQESKLYASSFSPSVISSDEREIEVTWSGTKVKLSELMTTERCSDLSAMWRIAAELTWMEMCNGKFVQRSHSLVRYLANPQGGRQ